MRATQIIATIGKVSQRKSVLLPMAKKGMDIARVNFSHENEKIHGERIRLMREIDRQFGTKTGILLDLKGPEVRLNGIDRPVEVKKGGIVYLSEKAGRKHLRRKRIRLTNPAFIKEVEVGSRILVDDGYAQLVVIKKGKKDLKCKAVERCVLKPKKSVSSEFVSLGQNAITTDDRKAIRFALRKKVNYLAVSHVRNAQDVEDARSLTKDKITILSKIENYEAVNNIRDIIRVSDGIVIARGDLGINLPIEAVPLVQEHILGLCAKAGKYAVVATQMMESMLFNSRPSRAEVNDVYTAVRQGANALWLSGETAVGKFPIETVGYMRKIIEMSESKGLVDMNHIEEVGIQDVLV